MSLEVGDIVWMDKFRAGEAYPSQGGLVFEIEAGKGRRAGCFLFLGMVPEEKLEEFDPNEQMENMGWSFAEKEEPEVDPENERLADGCAGLAKLVQDIFARNLAAGWWSDLATGERKDRNVAEMLALVHSEVSEALEGWRKGLMDDHLPSRRMLEVELADVVVRVCDMAGGLGLDLAGALFEKVVYNGKREDHKRETRQKPGGKAI
jgi:NTP pyrophosphatase (non-canonical NTP hydrolase)